MSYWDGISFKAIFLGFVGGSFVPYAVFKTAAYLLLIFGVTGLFGALPLFMVVYIVLAAPFASGYLGARFSTALPIINGMLATAAGVAGVVILTKAMAAFLYPAIVAVALSLGYAGAKKSVAHG